MGLLARLVDFGFCGALKEGLVFYLGSVFGTSISFTQNSTRLSLVTFGTKSALTKILRRTAHSDVTEGAQKRRDSDRS